MQRISAFLTVLSSKSLHNTSNPDQQSAQFLELCRRFKIICTNFTELHGNDPVDLQRQRQDQSHRGRHQQETEKLAPLSAYPGHDGDDEVMQDGPQHHRSSVGVVA